MEDGKIPAAEPAAGQAAGETMVLRLYLAPGAPNSVRALGNLQAICDEYLAGCYSLELVDVRQEPRRALADGILVTPALVRLAPLPRVKIVGNLSQRERVLHALGIAREAGAGEEGAHGRP